VLFDPIPRYLLGIGILFFRPVPQKVMPGVVMAAYASAAWGRCGLGANRAQLYGVPGFALASRAFYAP